MILSLQDMVSTEPNPENPPIIGIFMSLLVPIVTLKTMATVGLRKKDDGNPAGLVDFVQRMKKASHGQNYNINH